MSIRIVPFQPEHIDEIGQAAHDLGLAPIFIQNPQYKTFLKIAGPAFTGVNDGHALGCAGLVVSIMPWSGHVWGFFGKEALKRPVSLHKFVKRGLEVLLKDNPRIHRLEATVAEDHQAARDWLERLGFVSEGPCKAWGSNGEDYVRYSRIRTPLSCRS